VGAHEPPVESAKPPVPAGSRFLGVAPRRCELISVLSSNEQRGPWFYQDTQAANRPVYPSVRNLGCAAVPNQHHGVLYAVVLAPALMWKNWRRCRRSVVTPSSCAVVCCYHIVSK
jgi:hypothetical protein